ncbi:MAG: hypothetical protein GY924_27115 [Planctomycetaceae bacterium]|nr:hypothetical protein [Planctomycetaceae bacterium]
MTTQEYKLADWTIYPESNELKNETQSRRLESRVMDVLVYFCENPTRVISQSELTGAVWGRASVGANSLSVAIAGIRQALGDDAHSPKFIETVKKRGYRLLVPARKLDAGVGPNPQRLKVVAAGAVISVLVALTIFALSDLGDLSDDNPLVISLGPIANSTGISDNDLISEAIGDVLVAEFATYDGIIVRRALHSSMTSAVKLDKSTRGAGAFLAGRVIVDDAGLVLMLYLQARDTTDILWGSRTPVGRHTILSDVESVAVQMLDYLDIRRKRTVQSNTEGSDVEFLYSRARQLASVVSNVTIKLAHEMLLQAIEIAPEHGPSRGLLAEMYSWHYPPSFWGLEGDRFDLAEQQLELARRFGADEAYVMVTEAGIYLARDRQYEKARDLLHDAAMLRPNDPWVLRPQIWANMLVGDFEAALRYNTRAVDASLDPRSVYVERVVPLYYVGRFDEALEIHSATVELGLKPNPQGPGAAIMAGDQVSGFRYWTHFIRNQGVEIESEAEPVQWVNAGDLRSAYDWLRERSGQFKQDWNYPLVSASWHVVAGDHDLAVAELSEAIRLLRKEQEPDGNPSYAWTLFLHDPLFAEVRKDPRMKLALEVLLSGSERAYDDLNSNYVTSE